MNAPSRADKPLLRCIHIWKRRGGEQLVQMHQLARSASAGTARFRRMPKGRPRPARHWLFLATLAMLAAVRVRWPRCGSVGRRFFCSSPSRGGGRGADGCCRPWPEETKDRDFVGSTSANASMSPGQSAAAAASSRLARQTVNKLKSSSRNGCAAETADCRERMRSRTADALRSRRSLRMLG
jgi:hypothetical protein